MKIKIIYEITNVKVCSNDHAEMISLNVVMCKDIETYVNV